MHACMDFNSCRIDVTKNKKIDDRTEESAGKFVAKEIYSKMMM